MHTIETDTLVIGGGLAGLAAGYALEGRRPYIIAERGSSPGGYSATIRHKGYCFDFSGHLLHLRWPRTTELILNLLGDNCSQMERKAVIYMCGRYIPFPFQANLWALPEQERRECLDGFIKATRSPGFYARTNPSEEKYTTWSNRIFGSGISRHFMLPYNYKLLQHDLGRVTTEWCAPFVPIPDKDEIIRGASAENNKKFGYNATFRYPIRGGIGALAEAFAAKLSSIMYGQKVISVDIREKTATLFNSEAEKYTQVRFKNLINTSPLPDFIKMTKDVPEEISRRAEKLKYQPIYVLNLGVRKPVPDFHWAYFPEDEFPFYRAGISGNFSSEITPQGRSSFYLEFSAIPDFSDIEEKTAKALLKCGFIKDENQIETSLWLKINPAYVIYDTDRAEAMPRIMSWLAENAIQSIGRYGAWKYSFMEEAVKEGLEAADRIMQLAVSN